MINDVGNIGLKLAIIMRKGFLFYHFSVHVFLKIIVRVQGSIIPNGYMYIIHTHTHIDKISLYIYICKYTKALLFEAPTLRF